jgi:hypothetical protein
VWVERNGGGPRLWKGLRAAPDGAVYALVELGGDATLLVDTASPLTLVAETPTDAHRTAALVRFEPDGTIGWARRLVGDFSSYLRSFGVRPGGGVVVTGTVDGVMEVRDGADAVAETITTSEYAGWMASFGPDGAVEWLHDTGALGLGSVAPGPTGSVWIAAQATVGATDLPLAGELPELGVTDPDARLGFLLRVDAAGAIAEAHLVGVDVPAGDLAARDGTVVLGGYQYCHEEARTPRVVDATTGELTWLPECEPDANGRAVVVTFGP